MGQGEGGLEPDELQDRGVSRRKVLTWMAAGGGAALVATKTGGVGLGPLRQAAEHLPDPYAPPASILVARGADGLLLTLSFVNLDVQPRNGRPPQLVLRDATKAGAIVVSLPSQSIFEEAIPDPGPGAPTNRTVGALLSGPSRIVLKVPPGSAPLGYDLPTLLDLASFPLATNPRANASAGVLPTSAPGPEETALEAPYRLVLSPPATARFQAARGPVERHQRTELWHARGVPGDPTTDGPVPVRAIWSPDVAGLLTSPPAPSWAVSDASASITPSQRVDLVRATTTDVSSTEKAAPAEASLLLVSPMGASLDITGAWPLRTDVVGWRHRSWLGRDTYVKVEKPGFLFPFGFRAVQVDITERVIGGKVAYLRKRRFIVVRQPTITYDPSGPDQAPGLTSEGRLLPFSKVTTTTLVSPPLVLTEPAGPHRDLGKATWVRCDDGMGGVQDLRYRLALESQNGRVVTTDLPLAFVPAGETTSQGAGNPAFSAADMDGVRIAYDAITAASPADINLDRRRTLHLGGQTVGFVPRLSPDAEDPALPTSALVLSSVVGTAGDGAMYAARRLNAYPTMVDARVHMESLEGLVPDPTATITLHKDYLSSGLPKPGGPPGGNPGEVWAKVATPPKLDVPQQMGGGLAAPQFDVAGLSRAHGPVSAPDKIAKGDFNPNDYFDLPSITLLGAIPLKELVKALTGPISDPRGPDGDNVPKVITTKTANAVDTKVSWHPVMQQVKAGLFTFHPSEKPEHQRLDLLAVFHTDLSTQATTSSVTGDLRDSTLDFLGAIQLPLTRLHFESRSGTKPVVDLQLGKPAFQGDLRFLSELQDHLPTLPGGVKIDISPRGIKAGLSIAIPAVPIGVVLIENLAIAVDLDLPFDGSQAALTFSFSTREHPFHVTVMALGGGGFLGIGMGMRGIQSIEGALEFGASVALDFGVASGSLSIMAGIYIKFAQKLDSNGAPADPAGNSVVISGYVRALGELSVLGLIHASVEFYLGLTFSKPDEDKEGIVVGEASVTIRVEVLFFSTSVSVTVRKEIGSGVDPSFGDQISAGDWNDYCAAFAA
jgi:hypothetical protein